MEQSKILIYGKIIFRRRGRVGVEDSAGRVFYLKDMDVSNCPFENGTSVVAELIDDYKSLVCIMDIKQ